ncbi:MAG: hypothetical protein ABI240_15295 [Sphingomonas sp.]
MPLTNAFRISATIACATAVYILVFARLDTFLFFGAPLLAGVAGALVLRWRDPKRTPADHVTDAIRIYWALHLIWSASRYWVGGTQPPIPDPVGGPFMASLEAMGLYPGIKALEGIIGLTLLANRFVPLALIIEMPTSFNVFYLNVFITGAPRQLITGPMEIGVNCLLLLAYFRYYKPFLVPRAYAAPPEFLGKSAIDGPPEADRTYRP